ncbi:transcriptional regulator [Clostridiales bacterium COT073_COT-073]|nr:transcriptional regulator [Clostridiales bacterium COT073_COT-073]
MGFVKDNFEALDSLAKCIAHQFGPNCEVVLHDLTLPYDRTIVAIYNGHVTGRAIGGGGTNAGLEILRGTATPEDQYGYINYTKDGKMLRTSSKYFMGKDGKVEGSLCINLDITGLMIGEAAMRALSGQDAQTNTKEVFTANVDELLDILMQDAVESTGKQLALLTKEDKVAVVRYLDEKGAFLIKKSAEKVADFLGISRFTVYNYLNEGNGTKESEEDK